MTSQSYYEDPPTRLLSFEGRMGRLGFWLFTGITCLVLLLSAYASKHVEVGEAAIIYVASGLFLLVGSLAVCVKRLHDRDKSGWWLLLYYGTLVVLQFLPKALPLSPDMVNAALFTGGLIQLWAFIELGFLKGTDGPNRFG